MSKDDSRWRPPEGAQSDSSRAGDGKKLSARATSDDLPGVSPQRDVAPTLDTDDALRFVPPADDEAGGTRAHTGASAQADPSTGHAPTPDTPRAYPMAELLKYAPPRPKAFRKRATATKATTGTKRTATTKRASASATKRATAIKRTNAATATPTTTKRPTAAEATSASTAWEVLPSPTPSALTLKYRNKKAIERAKLLFYIILSVLSGIAYLVHAFTATPDPVAPPNMPFTGPTTPTVRLQGYSGTAHNTHALSPAWAAGVSTAWTIPLPSGVAPVTHPMYVDGSTLYVAFGVAAHSDRSTYMIAAYDLSSRTPRALWATPVSTDTPAALANDRPAFASDDDQIFFRSAILDKATGKQTSAPWGKDVPIVSAENIVVTCSTTTTCSGWTQEGDEWTNLWTTSTATQTGKLRDNDLGYAPANTVVSGSAEHTSVLVPTASTELPQIIDAHTGGACQFFCVWGLEVGGDSVGVGGGELGEGLFPVGGGVSLDEAGVSCSFVGGFASVCEALGGAFVFDVADGEPQEFDGGFFAGEMPAVLGDFTQLVVQRFDSVGGVHDAAQHGRERQERREALPGALPGGNGLGVARSQVAGRKLFERLSGGFLIGCAVDPLESGGDALAVLVGHETHGRAD